MLKWMLIFVSMCWFPVLSVAQIDVVINEFLASNTSVNPEMIDFDDFSDWIELYNGQKTAVNLDGYYLTDNLNNPLKWEIPAGTVIPAHGYILLWADGYDHGPGYTFVRPFWPWEVHTTVNLHTNFKISSDGEELGLFKSAGTESAELIPAGASWKYLDNGSDQGTAWRTVDFNDSSWYEGNAQLGYGDGDESTVLDYGPASQNKYITTCFRKHFTVENPDNISNLSINLLRDDGAVIYVNGVEVLRADMPSGDINYNTPAANTISGSDEDTFVSHQIDKTSLQAGENTIAVEIHQISGTSSDISFDLALSVSFLTDAMQIVHVDSVSFGYQFTDVSYGRDPAHPDEWILFAEPTPGSANASLQVTITEAAPDVNFSLENGFYPGTQFVSLSTNSANAVIRFTTDGSIPNSTSPVYSQPLSVSQTGMLRARSYENGKLPGIVATKTYFINEREMTLPVASLVIDPEFLWGNTTGIYEKELKQREVPSHLSYFSPAGKELFDVNAGVRLGGMNIWRFAQKPLTIYMRSRYGDDAINYKLFPNKPIGVIKNIVFRNGGDNWPTTMLQDAMLESIVNGQMENGIQAYTPCVLFLNGEYWGISNIRERFDPQYFASHYYIDPTNYDHLEYTMVADGVRDLSIIEGDFSIYNAMVDYMEQNDITDDNVYANVTAQLDVGSIIDYVITEIYVHNTSWRHNREWWRPRTEGAKWKWLIPDIDRGFNLDNVQSNLVDDYLNEYPLFSRLLQNDNFKNLFAQRAAAHLNSTFDSNRLKGLVDSLTTIVRDEMTYHIQKWGSQGGIPSISSWDNQLDRVKLFTELRPDVVFDDLRQQLNLDGTVELTINSSTLAAGTIFIDDVRLLKNQGRYFANIPLSIKAVPHVGYRFDGWDQFGSADSIDITLTYDQTLIANFTKINVQTITGAVTTDRVLSRSNSPYYVTGDVTVRPNTRLTIEEGVTVKMAPSASMYVSGQLLINGTETQPVHIIPNNETATKAWGALCFINTTDTCKLSHVIIEGATSGDDPLALKAAISGDHADVIVGHLTLDKCRFPMFFQYGSIVLTNSTIRTYITSDCINMKHGNARIENCTFWGTKQPDTDAIDYDDVTNGIICGNHIYNFNGFNCDAIDIGEEAKNVLIYGNVIYGSKDKGVSVAQNATVIVERNVIADCDMAVAVKDGAYAFVDQNTFFNNNIGVACYEKNYGKGGGAADVSNTIISGAYDGSTLVDSLSTIAVSYCLSDMDVLPGATNLVADPLFKNPLEHNVELQPNSVCYNAGNPEAARDPDNTIADIGAYYHFDDHDFPISLESYPIKVTEIMYNPSPVYDSRDWVELYNASNAEILLDGWTLTDEDTTHVFIFPPNSSLAPGAFLVVCRDSLRFTTQYPDVRNIIGELDFGFDDSDQVQLYNVKGECVLRIKFDNDMPWPKEPDGSGPSLELKNTSGLNDRPFNWSYSKVKKGTPGADNSVWTAVEFQTTNDAPATFKLFQNYPNPFNPTTKIAYQLPRAARVTLSIYNLLGETTATLVTNEQQAAGLYNVSFDATHYGSGVYFYQLSLAYADGMKETFMKKMVVVK
ncbi:lamin tail domain-containing protein [candidate division KSB1 bacterium]|nr:lamin tail domain-containing protein [candidate division KSB1 bacterium]